ncbi:MAG: acyltransferase [Treponema sp.]|nr:acyltransferase [Treponema sp.]
MNGRIFSAGELQVPSVPKENAFGFVRLACCLVVMYEHCVVLGGVRLPCLNLRGIAVDVFFILSGFWVTLSFLQSGSVKEYALKRVRRIFPQYALVVSASAVLLFSFSRLPLREYVSSAGLWKYLAANFCTLNFMHPNLPGVFEGLPLGGSVNGSLWTIKVEVGFYILLPFVVRAVLRLSKNMTGGGGSVVLAALYVLSVLWEVLMPRVTERLGLPSALKNQLPAFLSYFASGMAFAFYWKNLFPKLKVAFVSCAVLLAASVLLDVPALSAAVVPFSLSVVVMSAAFFARPLFGTVKKDFSYGMYLVHYPVAMCVVSLGVFGENPAFALLAVLGISFLCAYLLEIFQNAFFASGRKLCAEADA